MNVKDFWNMPSERRKAIQQEAKVIPAGIDGELYQVTGVIKWYEVEFCDCGDCSGHEERYTRDIYEIVPAKDEDDAIGLVESIIIGYIDGPMNENYEWHIGPRCVVWGKSKELAK